MIIFNVVGLVMLAVGFGLGYLAGLAIGRTDESVVMVIAGLLLIGVDVAYRARRSDPERWYGPWVFPKQGGQLFWLPIWFWGFVWLNIGGFGLIAS